MSNIIFVHKLYALIQLSGYSCVIQDYETLTPQICAKKVKNSPKEWRFIKWAQKGMHHDERVVRKLKYIKQMCTVISGDQGEGLGREKLVDWEFVWTLVDKSFQHHRFSVGYASCIHAQTQLNP